MCGFVAILGQCHTGELARMATAVARRGPDDRGDYDDGAFSAVHYRLSIIGPDERGRQPMTVDDVTVVFNGCIYNYRKLRKQLEDDGVAFASDTDTEVLPHLYRRFGMEMFSLLHGMFSIVLWDAREKQLLAARDPFGEKPLFICEQDGRAGFASVLSAFEQGNWTLTPDVRAVHAVLCRMRITAPRTMYGEVRQLPAGACICARPGEALTPRRFSFLPEPDQSLDMTPAEMDAEAERLLDDSFLLRTVSDRPMGVFLSGGVDSSLIAESLARQLPGPLRTFSVRFSDATADYDESAYAATVAKHIGSDHAALDVRADAHEMLHDLADAFDQPVANSAALPMYLIAREAKAHVDVALSGVGGDELFGGYPRYLGMAWHERLRHMPGRSLMLAILQKTGEGSGSRNLRGRLRRFVQGLDHAAADAYLDWTAVSHADIADMFTIAADDAPSAWQTAPSVYGGLPGLLERFGPVNGSMAWDILTYLPDDLLAVGDRMSMAHALELRAPFLDMRLANLALMLPARKKVAGPPWREGLKLLLKQIARKRLPAEIIDRPKQGFMAPVKHWLRGPLDKEVLRLAESDALGGLLHRDYVRVLRREHASGRDRSDALWGVLLLDEWMRQRQWSFK